MPVQINFSTSGGSAWPMPPEPPVLGSLRSPLASSSAGPAALASAAARAAPVRKLFRRCSTATGCEHARTTRDATLPRISSAHPPRAWQASTTTTARMASVWTVCGKQCCVWGVVCGVWGVVCGVWGVGCGVWGVGCGQCGVWTVCDHWWCHPSTGAGMQIK
jgi:hypothetical protein